MIRVLPREHGTWAMLLAPWLVGVGVARRVDVGAVLLVVAAVSLFLAHHHLMDWWRARGRATGGPADGHGRFVLAFTALGAIFAAPVLGGGRLIPLCGGEGRDRPRMALYVAYAHSSSRSVTPSPGRRR